MTIIEYAAQVQAENAIKGGNVKPEKIIYQVDKTTMKIVGEISCVSQFASQHSEFVAKQIHTAAARCGEYNGYIWLDKANIDKYYTVSDNKVAITITLDDAIRSIRDLIHNRLISGDINASMLDIRSDGPISISDDLVNILQVLDPRGIGNQTHLTKYQLDLTDKMKCGYALSYHGDTKTPQIALCLNTFMVFLRSKENLGEKSPACSICECGERNNFSMDNPECNVPVYRYNTAVAIDPYAFQQEYLTMADILRNDDGSMKPNGSTLKFLRESLFGKSNGAYPNGEPKRKKVQSYIFSFYPPKNGYLHEDDPSWILQRRLNARIFQEMRKVALS